MAKTVTFFLDESDLQIVQRTAEEHGGMSRSAALRFIIRDWARMRAGREPEAEAEANGGGDSSPSDEPLGGRPGSLSASSSRLESPAPEVS